jgi:ABC-type transport system involved in multi-copper enzyme maturation permease subunit
MNLAISPFIEKSALRALLGREFRAALINRYFQVFCALSLLGGVVASVFGEDEKAAAFFVLQLALYFVSLFALLAGVSSAQGEREEWQMLFTQPVPRPAFVIGKFFALFSIFGAVLLLLFLPAFISGTVARELGPLYGQTLLLAGVFLSLGLAAGFLAHDRAQGLIIGVSSWLFLLLGVDLLALSAARWPVFQGIADMWVGFLMLNPLDAFRIEALFALEQIPAEAANKTLLANWWIEHAAIWFALISIFWSATFIVVAGLRLNRWEE